MLRTGYEEREGRGVGATCLSVLEPQGLPSYHPELQSRFHRLFCSQEDLGIFRFVP